MLLVQSSLENATKVAKKIILTISQAQLNSHKDIKWTVSIGIAAMNSKDSIVDLGKRADKALYEAKNKGRNQAIIYTDY